MPTLAHGDLFSPGELTKAHHHLEGLQNCTQCHPAGQQLSQGSCLECHAELKPQLAKGRGLHGRIAAAQRDCEHCHHEHRGLTAPIIEWGAGGKNGFNHARTGWALRGGHLEAACGDCHQQRRIALAPVRALLEKHPTRETYLGLPTQCGACHFDEHRDQVGQVCDGCHVEKSWKPAPGFDHGQSGYPLTGKHARVACEKCHPRLRDETTAKPTFPAPKAETYLKYSPLEHQTCLECHKDPHDGRFGQRCSSCHTTEGWSVIRNASQERAFHDKTRYPLEGEHLEAPCTGCHGPWPGHPAKFKGLKFGACSDCHADAHLGQLAKPACEACHAVDGFTPVRFGVTQHGSTRFPLGGAHTTVGCLACHPHTASLEARIPGGVRVELKRRKRPELFSFAALDFKRPLDKCESCHADAHAGQLKDKPCSSCHRTTSFSALDFDHDTGSAWPLSGKHAEVKCAKCHAPDKKGQPVLYRGLATTCAGCHADVHAGQLARVRGQVTDCERCHETTAFKPAKFVHEPPFTPFLLDGRHATSSCERCHRPVKVAGQLTAVRYKPLPQTCEGCHADFHRGAFEGFEP
ncbi:MAG: hypothetical protein JNK82_33510 [Myxococcaceae bacterium]|nr:hypothetical protein [Myxococcaceae bacterium]